MKKDIAIFWFRQDLRLQDNPALQAATQHQNVLPIYILDTKNPKKCAMGGASQCWLHHSLSALQKSLEGNLSVYQGDPLTILIKITQRHNVHNVYWNRVYSPWQTQRDTIIKHELTQQNVRVHSSNASLLWEPWHIKKADGTPYKVFTPFYQKGCLQAPAPRAPLPLVRYTQYQRDTLCSDSIISLSLLPKTRWDTNVYSPWRAGESGAQERFADFLEDGLASYKKGRDFPAQISVSRLSAHLHFGEISPHQLWHSVQQQPTTENTTHFCRELGWREFAHAQLYYQPHMPEQSLQPKFARFSWQTAPKLLRAWQTGNTGIPMVDAGMRELWQTGYMHNRVRMIVGSFLVKNLRLHWHHGQAWFWDTLFDADLANNSASWQWVTGCGIDAAPYFRVFNPVLQGKKFDPNGEYIRRFVPELAALPTKYIYYPGQAPAPILRDAKITLGVEYPLPIVDIQSSRKDALAAFALLKEKPQT